MMSLFSDDCHYTVLGSTYSQSDYISVCSPPSRPPLATYTIPISCNSNIFIISTQQSGVERTKFDQNVDLGHILNNNIDKLRRSSELYSSPTTTTKISSPLSTTLSMLEVQICQHLCPVRERACLERCL